MLLTQIRNIKEEMMENIDAINANTRNTCSIYKIRLPAFSNLVNGSDVKPCLINITSSASSELHYERIT
jgi:hypothetical protein